jgi:hypothetical protein
MMVSGDGGNNPNSQTQDYDRVFYWLVIPWGCHPRGSNLCILLCPITQGTSDVEILDSNAIDVVVLIDFLGRTSAYRAVATRGWYYEVVAT